MPQGAAVSDVAACIVKEADVKATHRTPKTENPGAGGRGGIQPGSTGPYTGSATGAYNRVIVRANVYGSTGLA